MRNDGKYLEDAFQSDLENDDQNIWLHRFPDSKAARGMIAAQPADFLLAVNGKKTILIDCKSVKHKYRVPKFSQHGKMRLAGMAGLPSYLLVHHYMIDKYRVVNVKDLDPKAASHDLRGYEELDWKEAIERIVG
jgi:hypothetical protein